MIQFNKESLGCKNCKDNGDIQKTEVFGPFLKVCDNDNDDQTKTIESKYVKIDKGEEDSENTWHI
jgi:hypothetical protein